MATKPLTGWTNGRVATVQTDMRKRCKSVRLMKNKKRYECGWLVAHPSDRDKDEFQRELEVGTYAEAQEWLDETAA